MAFSETLSKNVIICQQVLFTPSWSVRIKTMSAPTSPQKLYVLSKYEDWVTIWRLYDGVLTSKIHFQTSQDSKRGVDCIDIAQFFRSDPLGILNCGDFDCLDVQPNFPYFVMSTFRKFPPKTRSLEMTLRPDLQSGRCSREGQTTLLQESRSHVYINWHPKALEYDQNIVQTRLSVSVTLDNAMKKKTPSHDVHTPRAANAKQKQNIGT